MGHLKGGPLARMPALPLIVGKSQSPHVLFFAAFVVRDGKTKDLPRRAGSIFGDKVGAVHFHEL